MNGGFGNENLIAGIVLGFAVALAAGFAFGIYEIVSRLF